jgi:hypothetical protein
MVLYASYACLLQSLFIENHLIDLEVTNPSFLRWFYHNHGTKIEEIQAKSRSHRNWSIQFGIPEYPVFPEEIEFD